MCTRTILKPIAKLTELLATLLRVQPRGLRPSLRPACIVPRCMRATFVSFSIFTWLLCLVSCGGGSEPSTGKPDVVATPTPTSTPTNSTKLFSNVSDASGIDYLQGYADPRQLSDEEKFCSGLAVGDVNQDGLDDVYIVRGDLGPHLLYINQGNLQFIEAGTEFGLPQTAHKGCGPAFADIDGDGDVDLFVGGIRGEPSLLFENREQNGVRTFVEVSALWGLNITATNTVSASFGDINRDGYPDMFLAHWGTPLSAQKQHLFLNQQGAGFQNITQSSGLAAMFAREPQTNATYGADVDYSFHARFADVDNDGWQDLLITADFRTSGVFLNNTDTTFTPFANALLVDENGMGSALGDIDNDGDLDWFVSAIRTPDSPGNRLYTNQTIESDATELFFDDSNTAGIADGGWAWAACMQDFNLDGRLDIFHVNGWSAGLFNLDFSNERSRLFLQNPKDESQSFTNVAREQGITDTEQGRAVACFDADHDGDIDILLTNNDFDAIKVYRNNLFAVGDVPSDAAPSFITVNLHGLQPNTQALGARIFLTTQSPSGVEITQMRELAIGSNFMSQDSTTQLFGVESEHDIVRVKVQWPSGEVQTVNNVNAGDVLDIHQSVHQSEP